MTKLLLIENTEGDLGECFSRPPLANHRWVLDRVSWNSFAFENLGHRQADLIVATVRPSNARVIDFLSWLRENPLGSPIIAVLPQEPEPKLVHDWVTIVDDFVQCPLRPEELRHRIARILPPEGEACASTRDRLNTEYGLAHLVGTDLVFVREIGKIPLAAQSDCEVLITGETGTGKELCARAIHHLSRRSSFPFVCVDCGALPDQLFENEMFGHARGAFTDAHRGQKGLVTIADKGTLFLDEVDSLSLAAQAKLLRFLEDRTYKPLGAEHFARADVRIVVATNRDLERAIEEKAFRRDLFFRINVLQVRMIPLRQRRSDIDLLALHFVDLCCAEMRCPLKTITPSSLQLLRSFDWPGNIRELYNVIRRAMVFSGGPRILTSHILAERQTTSDTGASLSFRDARAIALSVFERSYVEDMLRRHAGNVTRAAREAGKDRRVFGRLAKRHGIDPQCLK